MAYRTSPAALEHLPPGIPHIIGNEAAERFSFYGMKAVLAVFMVQYLHLMDGASGLGMSQTQATERVHLFNSAVYFTPLLGAIIADAFAGKYLTILWLSVVYCAGHAALACMGLFGNSPYWLAAGLGLIALGSGGIKPCVSAHVGDQFGARNAHLLPRTFNWFYFSVNIGAFVSMLLTPWLLEWHGPHWAFGVPGVLMALATVIFWLGRHRFIHVPPARRGFFREMFSPTGWKTIAKLLPLYLIVAMFWALFDQTGSTWIFQSQEMDRNFLGFEWLPSQIQSLNSVFVLLFIPLFAYWGYPAIDKIWKLSALRKIGIGLFLMAISFALVALIQQWIDGGEKPSIIWQIGAFALLTASEIMVSIVAMEFAYTQAPKTMKSLIMCLYLGAVALGNLFVAGVNHLIRIPDTAAIQLEEALEKLPADWRNSPRTVMLPGYDGRTGTADDFIQRLESGTPVALELPAQNTFENAAARIESAFVRDGKFPAQADGMQLIDDARDHWGNPIRYQILNSTTVRLISDGPDHKSGTRWDMGLTISRADTPAPKSPSWWDFLRPETPWLARHSRQTSENTDPASPFSRQFFAGGLTRLEGTAYFQFFTWLMLGTALVFIPYALLYKPRTYLQD